MPTISEFYGIIIRMFFEEHAPPHFHAQYAEHKAAINILTLDILEAVATPCFKFSFGLGRITP